jgi:cell division protein FtsB
LRGLKLITLALIAVIALLQHPLWLGKGGWLRVWEVDNQVRAQREANQKLALRNAALDAEVRDLKQGLDAIEERARSELGMIKRDEIFFQILDERQAGKPR